MGTQTANPGRTHAEVEKYNDGLKLMIKDMRKKNKVKDFESVATHIADFRRKWLQDPTILVGI